MPETTRDELSAAEPAYRDIASKASLADISQRLKAAEESVDSKTFEPLVRAIFLCGVFGSEHPEQAPTAIEILHPYLGHSNSLVRMSVGAAAIEIGRESPEGAAFRDTALARLLREPVNPEDAEVVQGWVLNALDDNEIAPSDDLKAAVAQLAYGDSAPGPAVRDKARGLLAGGTDRPASDPHQLGDGH